MSRSFKLEGGDLVVGAGRSFAVVSGKDKLFQDLKLWLLERVGTDPSTPTYGSTLDGGVIEGREIPSFIGGTATVERINEIRSEITDLLAAYQREQLEKMRREVIQFRGVHTLSQDEILYRVDSIQTAFVTPTVLVRITCSTLAGNTFQLTIPTTA